MTRQLSSLKVEGDCKVSEQNARIYALAGAKSTDHGANKSISRRNESEEKDLSK
jgi:hypothetical protein